MNIEDFKIKVTEEQSRIVQEVLFKNGYSWESGDECFKHPEARFLFFQGSSLTCAYALREYKKELPELTFEEFKQKYMKETLTTQVGGSHYQNYAIQPIEFIIKNNIPFLEANIIKYVVRYKNKNGLEDLKKAKHYLEMLIENYDTKE